MDTVKESIAVPGVHMEDIVDKLRYTHAPEGQFSGVSGLFNRISLHFYMFLESFKWVKSPPDNDSLLIFALLSFTMTVGSGFLAWNLYIFNTRHQLDPMQDVTFIQEHKMRCRRLVRSILFRLIAMRERSLPIENEGMEAPLEIEDQPPIVCPSDVDQMIQIIMDLEAGENDSVDSTDQTGSSESSELHSDNSDQTDEESPRLYDNQEDDNTEAPEGADYDDARNGADQEREPQRIARVPQHRNKRPGTPRHFLNATMPGQSIRSPRFEPQLDTIYEQPLVPPPPSGSLILHPDLLRLPPVLEPMQLRDPSQAAQSADLDTISVGEQPQPVALQERAPAPTDQQGEIEVPVITSVLPYSQAYVNHVELSSPVHLQHVNRRTRATQTRPDHSLHPANSSVPQFNLFADPTGLENSVPADRETLEQLANESNLPRPSDSPGNPYLL
ncbi:uncharacterized protein LOC115629350 isoform X2 [Scaptodrosophila lebanonensis]|uniref:Uncharacterized protein LOC115629350 isoform X2 n=1 Tax=Drosophila lebanonensis TaxID=7225 RepID=A0A6J2U3F5_DROLE|nr:uncharacterized protein LOC115629350 isoform X2 [Scaptodrosophila lebanonensis]